jgi:hypothetical protein
MEMFAFATKKKIRFETSKGLLSVEDLWDLPLTSDNGRPNLDDIAKGIYKAMKEGEEVSFVKSNAASNAAFNVLKTKFDIVKHIIDVKLAEAEAAKKAKEIKARNQRILGLIAQKEDEALASKSKEELLAMLAESVSEGDIE